jgi:Transposase DDE domain
LPGRCGAWRCCLRRPPPPCGPPTTGCTPSWCPAAARQRRYEQRVAKLAAAARARGKQPRARIKPRRRDEAPKPEAVANTTDLDSRLVHTHKGSLQGYNAQAVTTCEQVIVAAELTQQANDLQQLGPMLDATAATLAAAGVQARPGTVLADSGYWTIANLTEIPGAPELLIPPARHGRQGKPRKDGKPSESQERRAAGGDDRQAPKRGRQGPLRLAKADRRAGLRPGQGRPRRAAVHAPWAACLRRGVEAVVRHPQPAQAVAAPDRPATGNAGHHLSRKQERRGHQRGPPVRHSGAGFPRLARPPATYPDRL